MEQQERSHTERMTMETPEQFIGVFGIQEENIPIFKEELGVEIYAHGEEVTITGDPEKAALARETLDRLSEIVLRGEPVDRTRIRYAIELAAEGRADRIGEIMRDVIAITYRGRQVKCKTLGQKQYVDAIKQNTCTFAVGPAGTGKTYLAIAMADARVSLCTGGPEDYEIIRTWTRPSRTNGRIRVEAVIEITTNTAKTRHDILKGGHSIWKTSRFTIPNG